VAMSFGLRLSLIVFLIETLAGLLKGGEFEETIRSALILGGIFWGLGLLLGELARQIVEEHARANIKTPLTNPEHKTPSSTDK
jgi:hypothetical protein